MSTGKDRAARRRQEKGKGGHLISAIPAINNALLDRLPAFNEATLMIQNNAGIVQHEDLVSLLAEFGMAKTLSSLTSNELGDKGIMAFMCAAWVLAFQAGVESVAEAVTGQEEAESSEPLTGEPE